MSLFDNLKTDKSIEAEKDTLGGGGVLPTDAYDMVIDMAYVHMSKGGAMAIVLATKSQEGRNLKQTIYVSSGNAKGNKNYYMDKQGTKKYLPGFNIMNGIVQLTLDKDLGDIEPEERTISIYDFDAKKEKPTKAQVLTELIGQRIILGVQEQKVDKNIKDGNDNYVPSGETRMENEIVKVFQADTDLTVAEAKAGETEGKFKDKWVEKNQGKVRDKSTKDASKTAGGTTNDSKPAASIFG